MPVTDEGATSVTPVFCSRGFTDLAQGRRTHTVVFGREAYNSCPAGVGVDNARLRVALAWVFGIFAVVFLVLGVTVSPVALGVGVPFGIAAYILWYQASGRLRARIQWERVSGQDPGRGTRTDNGTGGPMGGRGWSGDRDQRSVEGDAISIQEAYDILGVSPEADPATIRQAYRDRVKEVHPDRGGDEATFKRVSRAYERLRDTDRV